MSALIVIPSRWASTRFPGKPLAPIAGDTLLGHVLRRVSTSKRASAVWVATDDPRIAAEAERHGVGAVLPEGSFESGTDRIAAALPLIEAREARSFPQVINVQGDEPLLEIGSVDAMIATLEQSEIDVTTLCCPLAGEEEMADPNVVKVVLDARGNALYFSRAPIPHGSWQLGRRHIGVYGYQTASLRRFAALAPTALERVERLEQLRALENGFTIRVLATEAPHVGVDRPEDVRRVEQELARLD